MTQFDEINIEDVVIGDDRIRKDPGDVLGLAHSIEKVGQLQPIVLTRDKRLVCGFRRLKALEMASFDTALCVYVDNLDDALSQFIAERDENTERLPFTREEQTRLAMRLEELEAPKAAKRKAATQAKPGNNGRSPTGEENLTPPVDNGKTRDKVASAVGMSGPTYAKAKEVVEAAESGDPVAQDALAEMNETGNVSAAFRRVTVLSGNAEWYTPSEYIEAARSVMGSIECDPASCDEAQETVQAETYFTQETNGLEQEWSETVWLNPPYNRGEMDAFVSKLAEEVDAKRTKQAVVLTNNCTDTDWWHTLAELSSSVCFTRGRIGFKGKTRNTQGQTFFYVGRRAKRFHAAFEEYGLVLDVSVRS